MKKGLIILLLFISLSPLFASKIVSSGIETSAFYYPSYDLSGFDELSIRSSKGVRFTIVPIEYKGSNFNLSLNTSFIIVSPSLPYNNIRNRGFSGFDLSLGVNYNFSDVISSKINFGVGALELGEADQEEAYFLSTASLNFKIFNKNSTNFYLSFPVNIIYRKQLLATTIGIGVNISLDWI